MDRTFRPSFFGMTRLVAGYVLCSAVVGLTSVPAVAQDTGPDQAKLVDDFLHYVLIAKPDLAEASADVLFATGLSDEDLADIISENDLEDKVERALMRGRSMVGVGPTVTIFERRLEDGRLGLARNQERIAHSIGMLKGSMRANMLGSKRLIQAGEYAVPQLLEVLVKGNDPELELAATKILESIKRQAVLPLSESLSNLTPDIQVKVVRILGSIGWPTSLPYLLDLAQSENCSRDVREASMQTFRRLGGTSTDTSAAYAALGRKFFDEEQSLVAYPGDARNMVWSYNVHSGLDATAVPTAIFSQVMAMQTTRRALELTPANRTALAIYVAADLRRENQLDAGDADPFAVDDRYTPQFFATASGADIMRTVLAMAIDSNDTALARDAIAALGETIGTGAKFRTTGREPLLECLRYPDRRVQYDAALVLGSRQPHRGFAGDGQVVPILASAVRTGDASNAIVIASSDESRNQLAGMLRENGFTVLNGGASFYEVEAELIRSSGVDLIVLDIASAGVREVADQVRVFERTSATPLMVVASGFDMIGLQREFASDRATSVWNGAAGQDQFNAGVENLLRSASGGRMSQSDAMEYTRDSLDILRMIALEQGGVYNIADAQHKLLEALGTISGGMRIMVAEVVALIPSSKCQQALIDAALSAQGAEQEAMLDQAAESARRIGSYADRRQIAALRQLISDSEGADHAGVADAAGRLYGSLNLSPDKAVKLITE